MPLSEIDRPALRREARELIRTASVPPLRFMALFLLLCLLLDAVSTAAGWFFRQLAPYDLSAFPPVLPRLGTDTLSLLFVSILTMLLATVLRAGFLGYCLGVHRGKPMPYTSLFDMFPFAGKVIFLAFLEGLLAGLGFMLFFFPGVYVLLVYSLALFHLCDDPDAGVFAAMRRSRADLSGHFWEYFLLLASFLPLLVLVGLPVGLLDYYVLRGAFPDTLAGNLLNTLVYSVLAGCASLYVEPYLQLTKAGFYRRLTEPPAETAAGQLEKWNGETSDDEENKEKGLLQNKP